MVQRVTENGMRGQADCIDRECRLPRSRSGYLIMIPGDAESIRAAAGRSLAVHPADVADLEAMR